MTYLIGYVAIGVLLSAALLVSHYRSRARDPVPSSALLDAYFPERASVRYVVLSRIVAALTGALVVVGWPIVLAMIAKERLTKQNDEAEDKEEEFAVARRDLLERLSISQIEERERVQDPLGGVPDVPFGHLNVAWKKYKAELQPHGETWSFSNYWTTPWGQKEWRTGYVSVHDRRLGAYFLTMRKPINGT